MDPAGRIGLVVGILAHFGAVACAATPVANKSEPSIAISLSTSRPEVTIGAGFGIAAEVKNVSAEDIYLVGKYSSMTTPPEIDPSAPSTWWAVIPGNQKSDQSWYTDPVILKAGDTTSAFWAGYRPASSAMPSTTESQGSSFYIWWSALKAQVGDFVRIATFTPGQYDIVITALYWPDEQSADLGCNNYHSAVAHIKVPTVAPEWVVLFGAVLGGLIAYILLPKTRLKPNQIEPLGLASAALLSSIVTILLSRISDTQFFVRINVNDLWGAMAVGFVAAASGSSYLQQFLPDGSGTVGPGGSGEPAAGHAQPNKPSSGDDTAKVEGKT